VNKPKMKEWQEPVSVSAYPIGATCDSNHITSINSGWRTYRPVINQEKCVNCMRCFLVCPDGVIDKSGKQLAIDYDFCKGCGVCAYECKLKAIDMVKEADCHE
jgi:pyruvate ferredoxin oxidoreductase delta subunit